MRKALKLALEALEIFAASYSDGNEAIIAIKEALAQPEPPQSQPTWNPIETAPKDGSSILIVHGESIRVTHWIRDGWFAEYGNDGYGPHTLDELFVKISHWSHLPEPLKLPTELRINT